MVEVSRGRGEWVVIFLSMTEILLSPSEYHKIIAELAERSPIIIQNSSNPSSRKNLDLRPCDRKTDRTRCYF